MKLMIDIPNGLYPNLRKMKNGSIATKRILDCVRNGTPLSESEDCISRQAVLEVIEKCHCEEWVKADIGAPIEALQPITPQPKIGRWILQPSNKEQGERDFIWWKCSECGQVIYSETEQDRREYHSYCGRCGTKMQEVEYE